MKKPSAISTGNKVTVVIDPDLEDIIPGFLENRRGDLKKLEAARQQRDAKTVQVLGHRMKGDGGGYGFDAISAIGEALEQAALRQDWTAIARQTIELGDFLTRVEVVYRR
jgi:HPt (histidine-containing phosphotransfer) domain-containing protein